MTQTTSVLNVQPLQTSDWQKRLGFLAALATVLIWSCYFLSLRFSVLSPLGSADLLLMRYVAPGLILLPVFLRSIKAYRQVHLLYLTGIVLGSGIGFFLITLLAMRSAGVIFGSTLVPGTAPLFVTLLAVTLFRQPLPKPRAVGLLLILTGIAFMLANAMHTADSQLLVGQLMLLAAGFIWACFTLSVRQSGLRPLQVAALVTVPNGLLTLLWLVWQSPPLTFAQLPLNDVLLQLLVQGLLVGILSGLLYSTAIRRLGAETTATLGSATPVVATLLASVYLQEALEIMPLLGLCFTVAGVYLANRITQP